MGGEEGQSENAAWSRRWGLQLVVGLVGGLAVVVLCVLWWRAPAFYDGPDAATAATTRAGILVVIGAIVAALGATFALLETHRANRDAHQRARDALDETHRANREADQRERFAKAIDQLGTPGDDKIDVRLGGIYTLQRIAQDFDRDLPTVVEVLCAFIRGHGKIPDPEDALARDDLGPDELEKLRPPTDVQAALTVIGRIHTPGRSHVDLVAARLDCARLVAASFSGAFLNGAYLRQADLEGTDLRDAELGKALLYGTRLSRADLTKANLPDADLSHAFLDYANLEAAYLRGAHLSDAFMRNANLSSADLRGADLSHARLTDADLSGADLADTNLASTSLTRANLAGAKLTWDPEHGIDLGIFSADYRPKGLTQQQIDEALGD